jgi:hypothetical protein
VNAEWVVAVINETDRPNADGEVTGLADLNGRSLEQLYGTEHVQVHEGAFVTRLLPYEVKLFATSRKGEAKRREGRDYIGVQNAAPEARP